MRRPGIYDFLMGAAALLALTACEHKELCFNHPEHALRYASYVEATYERVWEVPYGERTDWTGAWSSLGLGFGYDALRPTLPEGLRVSAYDAAGKHAVMNLQPEGEEIQLTPGENALLFYNNDTHYIVFTGMDGYATANASTRTRTRASYTGNPFYPKKNENTVAPPDVLFGHYIDSYLQERSTEAARLPVAMHPLVFTYVVRYRFARGLDYVALARGALSGMAASVYLHNGRTSDTSATILYDCTVEPWGVQAVVRSFGVPGFPNPNYEGRAENSFGLNLEVRLHNGKTLNYFFDITDQMTPQPHGGVVTVEGIEVSDEEGASGGSAFDVSVEGWGEFEDVEIDLK